MASGATVPETVTDLYAAYVPTKITVKLYWNGWQGKYTPLIATRDYGTSVTGVVTSWEGHTLDGWAEADGTPFNVNAPVTKNMEVYMIWHGADGSHNQGYVKNAAGDVLAINVGPSSLSIDPDPQSSSGELYAAITSSNQFSTGKTVKWSVNNNVVSLTPMGENMTKCLVRANGSEGTAVVKAAVTDSAGKVHTASATVTVAHSFDGNIIVTKYPTCTENGEGYTFCSTCNTKRYTTWEKNGHRFTYHTTNPNCTEEGCTERWCISCGLHERDTIVPALGHNMEVKTLKSCSGTTIIQTCRTCGFTEQSSDASQASHTWASVKTVDKEATCKEAGSKSIHCLNCEVTKDSEPIPATDNHDWGAWKETKPATAEAAGTRQHTCEVCGLVEEAEIAPLANKDEAVEEKLPANEVFTDVSKDAWSYDAVNWAYANGVFSGYTGQNVFGVGDALTRAQAAQVLYNWFAADGAIETSSDVHDITGLSDVQDGKWYTKAVNWAYSKGLIVGYSDKSEFGVNDPLTRQQMCEIMRRASVYFNGTAKDASDAVSKGMPDVGLVANYAKEGVDWATSHGVMNGVEKDDGNFYINPSESVTRAQMAQFMKNAVDNALL